MAVRRFGSHPPWLNSVNIDAQVPSWEDVTVGSFVNSFVNSGGRARGVPLGGIWVDWDVDFLWEREEKVQSEGDGKGRERITKGSKTVVWNETTWHGRWRRGEAHVRTHGRRRTCAWLRRGMREDADAAPRAGAGSRRGRKSGQEASTEEDSSTWHVTERAWTKTWIIGTRSCAPAVDRG